VSTTHVAVRVVPLPTVSMATTVSACGPSLRPAPLNVVPQTDGALPSRLHVTTDASLDTIDADTDVSFVGDAGPFTVSIGAVVSITHAAEPIVAFPAASIATTLRVCEPSRRPLAANVGPHTSGTAPSRLHITVASPVCAMAADTAASRVGEAEPCTVNVGAVRSITQAADVFVVFPTASVATTFSVCAPSASPLAANVGPQGVAAPSSSVQTTVAASPAAIDADTTASLVGDDGPTTDRLGAVVSITHIAEPVAVFPTASTAITFRAWAPWPSAVAENVGPHATGEPPSRTHVTADAPVAVMVADTEFALVGDGELVTDIVGAVVSMSHVADPVALLPAASVATTASVCRPSPRPRAENELAHADAGPSSSRHDTVAAPLAAIDADTDGSLVGDADPDTVRVGAVVSMTHAADPVVRFPTASVATTVSVCAPSGRRLALNALSHATGAPPSRPHSTVAAPADTMAAEIDVSVVGEADPKTMSDGAVVSIAHSADRAVALPATSVATTVSVCTPSPRPSALNALAQGAATPSSRRQVTVAAPDSRMAAETEVWLVGEADAISVKVGAVASIAHVAESVVMFPAASVATTASMWNPSRSPLAENVPGHGDDAPPSRLQSTDAAPLETIAADTNVSFVGEGGRVIDNVGGVVSTTHSAEAVVLRPVASVATTSNVCAPSLNPLAETVEPHESSASRSNVHVTVAASDEAIEADTDVSLVGDAGPASVSLGALRAGVSGSPAPG
jgi:hypothetical protein